MCRCIERGAEFDRRARKAGSIGAIAPIFVFHSQSRLHTVWRTVRNRRSRRFPRMTNRELAISFVERFCDGDLEAIASLLADELRFRGPFHQFDSRDAYLSCLSDDPLPPSRSHILSVTEHDDHVAVFYEYQKKDGSVTIGQLFKCRDERIIETLLVFDGREAESK